jgi:hypothetical protein
VLVITEALAGEFSGKLWPRIKSNTTANTSTPLLTRDNKTQVGIVFKRIDTGSDATDKIIHLLCQFSILLTQSVITHQCLQFLPIPCLPTKKSSFAKIEGTKDEGKF